MVINILFFELFKGYCSLMEFGLCVVLEGTETGHDHLAEGAIVGVPTVLLAVILLCYFAVSGLTLFSLLDLLNALFHLQLGYQ